MFHLLSSLLNTFEGKPVNGCTVIGWVHEAPTAVKARHGDVSLIFNVTDDSMERQLPTEQRRYFCKIVLYLVKNSKVPTLHWGDVVLITNLTMKRDTNPRGTTEAIGTCFQGTKGKWSMHAVAYEDYSAGGPYFPAAKFFGKKSVLPDKGRQAMQLIAQSVAEVAATALAPHHHPPVPAAHPVVETYTRGPDPHTLPGHARALAAAVPADVGGVSHGYYMAARAASAAAADHGAMTTHPPPPPHPPGSGDDASPRALLAAQPAGACMHDAPTAHSPPQAGAPVEPRPAAVDSPAPVATPQRAREDTPEPSPRAIPFAQSASLLADTTPAAARRVSGRASTAPAALASVSAGVTPAAPPPPPPEDLGRPASAGLPLVQLQGSPGVSTKRPLCNIAHSTVTEPAHGPPSPASTHALQAAAGAPSLERPPAELLSPATTESAPERRRVPPATPAALLGALATQPANGTPTQPQWTLSASSRQDHCTAAAVAEQDSQLQSGLHVGARLQPLLPPCALTPASSNTPSPATEQHLDPLQPTELPPAGLSPDMQPTEQQAADQESPDLQPTELQQPDIRPIELQQMNSQDTEIEPAAVLPSSVLPTELQQVESQPAPVLPARGLGAAPVPRVQPAQPRPTEQPHAPQPEAQLARSPALPTARRPHGRTLPTSLQATQPAPQLPQHAAPGTARPARAAPGSPYAGPRRRQTCDRAVQTTPSPDLRRTAAPQQLTAASLKPPTPAAVRFTEGRRRHASAPAFGAVPAKRARPAAHNTAPRAAALRRSAGEPTRSSPQTLRPLPPALPHTPQPQPRVLCSGGKSGGGPRGMGGGGIATPPSARRPAIQGSPDPRSKTAAMAARAHRPASAHQPRPFAKGAAMHAVSAGGAGRPRRVLAPAGRASAPVGADTDVEAGGGGRQLACFPGRDLSVMSIRAALLRGETPHAAS